MSFNRRPARLAGRVAAALLVIVVVLAPSTQAAAQPGDWWHHQWQLDQVWQISDGTGVTVAILDNGVDATAAELAGAVLPGIDLSGQAPDGRTDHDPGSHGTHMALLVAGNGEVTGLPGMAPGATILPVIDADDGTIHRGNSAHQMEGIQYAVDQGAHVINISTGALGSGDEPGDTCPPEVADAVRYAVSNDVIVVAGAGNRAGGAASYPASCPGVLTIGAIDQHGEPWEDSHRSIHVDLAAPGVGMNTPDIDGGVSNSRGTSNSSALVSGAVALLRAHYPDASAGELVTRLLHTAHDAGEPGHDRATGYGIVDPLAALTATIPPDTPNPVYEPLGDLTNVPPPTIAPPPPPPQPADVPAPLTVDDRSSGLLPIILLATGALLALAAGAAIALYLRSRRT